MSASNNTFPHSISPLNIWLFVQIAKYIFKIAKCICQHYKCICLRDFLASFSASNDTFPRFISPTEPITLHIFVSSDIPKSDHNELVKACCPCCFFCQGLAVRLKIKLLIPHSPLATLATLVTLVTGPEKDKLQHVQMSWCDALPSQHHFSSSSFCQPHALTG